LLGHLHDVSDGYMHALAVGFGICEVSIACDQ
jgi:hypothetical protein